MTKQEMLASVEAQIRKDIPRLMELKEGCLIEYFKGRYAYECKVLEVFPSYFNVYLNGEIESINFDLSGHTFQIIGHDIMLNDVLEWLNIKLGCSISKGRYAILPNGDFIFIEYEQKEGFDIVKTFIQWNLSSPYLKDQIKELIEFLYNLKNK